MGNALYDIYKKSVFELAATVSIKINDVALAINRVLKERGYVVQEEPTPASPVPERTWKYYMNIMGEYHVSDMNLLRLQQQEKFLTKYGPNSEYDPLPNDTSNDETLINNALRFSDYMIIPYILVDGSKVDVAFTRELIYGGIIKTMQPGIGYVEVSQPYPDFVLAEDYRYNTLFYNELADRYQGLSHLINGILKPLDNGFINPDPFNVFKAVDIAIQAKDGDVLVAGDYYRRFDPINRRSWFAYVPPKTRRSFTTLVESNEDNLIEGIETWVRGFLYRWNNPDYAIIDDLYIPSLLGVMFANLPMAIMNIRLANCKTNKAHSYHIRQYLESHGKLSQYIPVIGKKAALYLYRNVNYIQANMGKQAVFDDMIKNLLVENRVPLAGYEMRHNLADLNTVVADLNDNDVGLNPTPYFQRLQLGPDTSVIGSDQKSVEVMIDKEILFGREGQVDSIDLEHPNRYGEHRQDQIDSVTEETTFANDDNLVTKVVESQMIDNTDRRPFPFAEMLFNLWIYYAYRNKYNGRIVVYNPVTLSKVVLSPIDAVILYFYCFNKGHVNIELQDVPTIMARWIPRQVQHEWNLDLPDRPTTPDDFNQFVNTTTITDDMLQVVLGDNQPERTYRQPDEFYEGAINIHRELVRRYYYYVSHEDQRTRAQMEYAVSMMYWHDVPCPLVEEPTTYADWLLAKNINLTGLTQANFVKLAKDILAQGTGAGDNTNKTLRELQRATISIMKQFSSYGIQYIFSIDDNPIIMEDAPTLRGTNIQTNFSGSLLMARIPIVLLDLSAEMIDSASLDLMGERIFTYPDAFMSSQYPRVDVGIRETVSNNMNTITRVRIPTVRVLRMSDDFGSLTDLQISILSGFGVT